MAAWVLVLAAYGQSTTQGVVGGTVAGPGGVALANAEIDLTSSDTGHIYQSETDAQGNFRFLGLPPGNYEAWITESGFARLHVARVAVEVGRFTPLMAHLVLAKAEETIEVREPGAVIDLSSPALSTNIDETSIDELPSEQPSLVVLRTAHARGCARSAGLRTAQLSRHQRAA